MTTPAFSLPPDMTLEEAQRRIMAAVQVLTEIGFTVTPAAERRYTVEKPDGFRRHQVVCRVGDTVTVIERFWQWDRADDLCERLNRIERTS